VKLNTIDTKKAEPYQFRNSTAVLFEKELVPADIATDRNKTDHFCPLSCKSTQQAMIHRQKNEEPR